MDINDRQDEGLAFMLKFENVAWYDEGCVRILDRRIYPIKTRYEICRTHSDVAHCISEMVTQSEGPYAACAMGMILAARECKDKREDERLLFMKNAAKRLYTARPTTSKQMQKIAESALSLYEQNISLSFKEMEELLFRHAYNYVNGKYRKYSLIGESLASLIPKHGGVLTHCFPGTVVGTFLRAARRQGKEVELFCSETRPYFQGSRLTASVACDMGADVTVITDNMVSCVLSEGKVDLFTTASDVITMDCHIVNKVGTLQIALACRYFHVPYYVTGTPDAFHKNTDTIVMEKREASAVLHSFGTKLTMDGVKGYYPAFDITPPELVSAVISDKGVMKPCEMDKYFL